MRVRASCLLIFGVTTACGQAPADTEASMSAASESSGAASTTATSAPTTGAPGTTSGSTGEGTTTGEAASSSSEGGATTSGSTSGTGGTSGDATTGEGSSSGEASTGDGVCTPDEVLDAVSYNYVKTTDVGLEGVTAGFFNALDLELVFLTGTGEGVRLALDGSPIDGVMAPAAVAVDLDGAVYDPATHTALLVDHDCNLAEVDPVTLAEIDVEAIDTIKFDLGQCSALALGYDGNLYVGNLTGDEVVVISRDLKTEVDRFDVAAVGIAAIDGISLIPGSENFLVTSNDPPVAAILSAQGEVVAPITDIGGPIAPLVGGVTPEGPDALFSVCTNGQVWLCGGPTTTDCYKYAPEGGGGDVCGCLLPP
jgi:hypothetical protein